MATCLAAIAIVSSLFVAKNVDLRVYWYGVNGYFSGTQPAYGPASGLGFPMEYRYPPVTYLLLFPLKWLPLRTAGICWMLAAWANASFTVWLAIRIRHLQFRRASVVACCAFTLAYVVLAVRYGNVQPFVIAWIFAALVLSETRPVWAGVLLALAVTFKIWPVMFVVLLLRRIRMRSAYWFVCWLAALWLFPVAVYGPAQYGSLLHEWFVAVRRVGDTYSEFYYFPSQSLRGILLRYLTPVAPPLASFPKINFISLPPRVAVDLWMIASVLAYSSFAVCVLRSSARKLWAWDGLAFVVYSLLEPFAVKSGLISLAPAALVASSLFALGQESRGYSERQRRFVVRANRLFLAACVVSFLQAVLQYRPLQRYLLSFGLDFWGELLLAGAFVVWIGFTRVPEGLYGRHAAASAMPSESTRPPISALRRRSKAVLGEDGLSVGADQEGEESPRLGQIPGRGHDPGFLRYRPMPVVRN